MEPLLTPREVADVLGISIEAVRRFTWSGILPSIKLGGPLGIGQGSDRRISEPIKGGRRGEPPLGRPFGQGRLDGGRVP
ncbi:helix-turn-helix domain-containing protein [Methanoculleus horonobensis]|uniref:helix-turn-helix domain-containing protein n=1 Tax=Methanoculleus horonobensis TaxID=528314 RepID=UPI001290490D